MSYQALKKKWLGKRMDYDGVFRYQCVDLIKQYAAESFGVKPGAWGDAIDYARRPAASFLKVFEKTNNPVQGDIVIFSGGLYGHIALVDGLSATAVNALEQNGATGGGSGTGGDAVRTRWIPKSRVAAYYTPKDKSVNSPELRSEQRLVGKHGVNYRDKPSLSAKIRKEFKPGEILDFGGYVKGASYKGNNIWFKGKYSGGYSWSGSFTDKSTKGLKNLTPDPKAPEPVVPDPIKEPIPPEQQPEPTPEPTPPANNALALGTVVNKKNRLFPSNYAPNTLRDVGGQKMELEAATYMKMMIEAAAMAGFVLTPASGYRSYETQEQVYQRWVDRLGAEQADRESARPGHSEHQTGYTMDFAPIDPSFANTSMYRWLTANAYRFGFVLRYPDGKESVTGYIFEPWHWRYVGIDFATQIARTTVDGQIFTLEEFFGIEGGLYPGQDPVIAPPVVVPPVDTQPPVVAPPEPVEPPAPPSEAAKSSARFLARLGTQLAAAKIAVDGVFTALASYSIIIDVSDSVKGGITLAVAAGVIFFSQFGYKLKARFKWFF